jgi:GAF domain-containing protein
VQARTREVQESLEYQTAISGVLNVISRSPAQIGPVLDAIAETAQRLCRSERVLIFQLADGRACLAADRGENAALVEYLKQNPVQLDRGSVTGRVLLERRTVHIPDVLADPEYNVRQAIGLADPATGADWIRTALGVPLLREGATVGGVIVLGRSAVQPYTEHEIELITTFADQAVIAIENARLFDEVQARTKELTEALEQQTATSEVLQVISSSPGELEPVFEKMLENATRICDSKFGSLLLYDGNVFRFAAIFGAVEGWFEFRRRQSVVQSRGDDPLGRLVATKQMQHTADIRAEPAYLARDPEFVPLADVAGARTLLTVPMLKEGVLVGAITIYRQEVRPFTDKQIELVQNFANQAVIAIENTRLLNELHEALEQQTATSEVLSVISSSPSELQPVFDKMLENATRICAAKFGNLVLREGDALRMVAGHGLPPAFDEFWRSGPLKPSPKAGITRAIETRQPVHIADFSTAPTYLERHPLAVAGVELGGIKTLLLVPMLKGNEAIGALGIYRQEVLPFTDKQIDLVTNFAKQAVIAIENARLLSELRESLQQQTATSEVLQVISSSPGELQPVFDKMLENATRICDSKFANLLLYDGNTFRVEATFGAPEGWAELRRREPLVRLSSDGQPLARVVATGQLQHVADLRNERAYIERNPFVVPLVEVAGARTLVTVPMLKEGAIVGAITMYRQQVRPFTDKQIELVQNFANQAVIAIENTRLLRELRESLEQQTATSEVLSVISTSPGELDPVFKTILENATRICEAGIGNLLLYNEGAFRNVSFYNTPEAFPEQDRGVPFVPPPNAPLSRVLQTKQPVHVADIRTEAAYKAGFRPLSLIADIGGARTLLAVPMLKNRELVGVVGIYRQEVRPFTDKQIKLVQSFASQAVIAIENSRLLNELRARTIDLARSVEELHALGDVGQAVNSTVDLETVLTTIVAKATQLSSTEAGAIYVFDDADQEFRLRATYGMDEKIVDEIRDRHIRVGETAIGEAAKLRTPIQIPDVQNDPSQFVLDIIVRAGFRALLIIPLLGIDRIVGALVVRRRQPGARRSMPSLAIPNLFSITSTARRRTRCGRCWTACRPTASISSA